MIDEIIAETKSNAEILNDNLNYLDSEELQENEEFKKFKPEVAKGIMLKGLLNQVIYQLSMLNDSLKNSLRYELKSLDQDNYSSILAEAELELVNNMTGFRPAEERERILKEFQNNI